MRPFRSPAVAVLATALTSALALASCASKRDTVDACLAMVLGGFAPWARSAPSGSSARSARTPHSAGAASGRSAWRGVPWLDWQSYWATGDAGAARPNRWTSHLGANGRGIDGALLDLEYQRIELIKFNLFDNYRYLCGLCAGATAGARALKVWKAMRLPAGTRLRGRRRRSGAACRGELIRFRTLTGICNDMLNPLIGSAGQLFARNVEFEATFPELGETRSRAIATATA